MRKTKVKRISLDLDSLINGYRKRLEMELPNKEKRQARRIAEELMVEQVLMNPIDIDDMKRKRKRSILRF